ncbi:MAG: hypothetical protein SCH39_13815, partial [Methanosarcinales archaeon]|nr:hypothetical protein [Methanosarcinales archaeon]
GCAGGARLSAGNFTSFGTVFRWPVGSNTTPFDIRYNVTTTISKSLYGINELVDINISVFDAGPVPVSGAVLTVNITNSTVVVENLAGSNITDNSNGYYNTSFTPAWSDDFNISVHVVNGSVTGDASIVPFRATGFSVNATPDSLWYEAGDTVTVTGNLWDSQGSPR